MVEVSTLGTARRTIFCRNVRQNIARIDRIPMNVVICRTFSRAVLLLVIDRRRGYRPADRPPEKEPFCGTFSPPLVMAVGAVGILASCTDSL
jgi:hypothetical protein